MSGFKKSALEISILANPVTPTDANNLTLQANSNNKLVARNFSSLSEVIAYESTVALISAGLQSQINNITGSGTSNHNSLAGLQGGITNQYYHLTAEQYNDYIGKTVVSGISAGLQSQINSDRANYTLNSTTALISAGLQTQITNNFNKFDNYTLNSTTSVISAGLANRIGNVEANYTLNSTAALISAGLNTRLNGINIIAGSNITVNKAFDNVYTISSVGGGGTGFTPIAGVGMTITAPTSSSYQFDVTDYISKTEVSGISAGLQSQTNSDRTNYTLNSTTALISAGLQTQITSNLNKFNDYTLITTTSVISAGLASRIANVETNYTLNSTTALISAGLNTRLNNINIIAGSNVTVSKAFDNVYTISSASGGGGTGFTPVAGTGMTITAPTSSSYLFTVTDYIGKTEVASISAGLNTKITNIQNNYTLLSTTSAISSGLQTQINSDRANYTLNSTTALISAGLNTRLNNINIIAGSNVTVSKAFDNVYTISSTSAGGSGGSSTFSGLTDVSLTSPVTGQMPIYNGNVWINKYPKRTIPFTIVSSSAITSGAKDTMFIAPWKGNITDWQLSCTPSASITLDILKATNAVPTNTIITSNYPSIISGQIGSGNTSGWTTNFNKNDVFKIKVNSNNNATIITLQLNCEVEG